MSGYRAEIALVSVAFAVGLSVAGVGLATPPERGTAERASIPSASPSASTVPSSPAPEPTASVEPGSPPVAAGPILLGPATSNFVPNGCSGVVSFRWQADPASDPPYGETAVIRVTGGDGAGTYRRVLTRQGVSLQLQVRLSSNDRWTADIVSIGDRDVFPTPLEVTSQNPLC